MSAKLSQILIVLSALVLFVLLFIAPKSQKAENKVAGKAATSNNSNIDLYVSMAQKVLSPELKKKMDGFATQKNYDSLVSFWDRLKRPDIASYFVEQKAIRLNTSDAWFKTGERYYYAIQFSEDKSEIPLLYQCAMRTLSKTLALNPKNNEAKILLASCYVEGSQNPMDGISLLREVEKTDSNNVKLQLAFAFFSLKSQQFDKAISRFNKVLRVDSTYIEAYLHLADAYERQGEIQQTITMLEKYSVKTPDVTARLEIEKYIKQLKSNINK